MQDLNQESALQAAQNWIKIADLDGQGTISVLEFNEFFTKMKEDIDEEMLTEKFKQVDEADKGEIDAS